MTRKHGETDAQAGTLQDVSPARPPVVFSPSYSLLSVVLAIGFVSMTNERLAKRLPFTEAERAIYSALVTLVWRPGSLDLDFIHHLSTLSVLSAKQSRRLHKLAHARWTQLPLDVRDLLVAPSGVADEKEALCADRVTMRRYIERRDAQR